MKSQRRGRWFHRLQRITTAAMLFAAAIAVTIYPLAARSETPAVGAKAPDFTLSTPDGQPVRLASLTAKGPVVLIVLRGYPGYQCPFCEKQAHDFQVNAGKFAAQGVQLLLVYPGPPAELDQRAREFLVPVGALPANYRLVIDPDYKITNLYDLRWNAPRETAYPSTFLLNKHGVIVFRKISHTHGDRTSADDVLAELAKIK